MTTTNGDFELSKEEKAFFLKAIWQSLQEPEWTKDDLIEFGKAIFDKESLKTMNDTRFAQIFPFLEKITHALTEKIRTNTITKEETKEPTAEEKAAAAKKRKELNL